MQEPEQPSVSPAWFVALIATIVVIGAVAVYLLAKAGHRADDLHIADYHAGTAPWFAVADEAHRSLQDGDAFDRERLDDAYGGVLTLVTPGILDPLHDRDVIWFELLVAANELLATEGDTAAFRDALQAAEDARAEADRERAEIDCNADPATC